jgi:hypothetical protein
MSVGLGHNSQERPGRTQAMGLERQPWPAGTARGLFRLDTPGQEFDKDTDKGPVKESDKGSDKERDRGSDTESDRGSDKERDRGFDRGGFRGISGTHYLTPYSCIPAKYVRA